VTARADVRRDALARHHPLLSGAGRRSVEYDDGIQSIADWLWPLEDDVLADHLKAM